MLSVGNLIFQHFILVLGFGAGAPVPPSWETSFSEQHHPFRKQVCRIFYYLPLLVSKENMGNPRDVLIDLGDTIKRGFPTGSCF